MKETNKLLNTLINYTIDCYKIMYLIKLNVNVFVLFLLNKWMKRNMNLLYKCEHKNKLELF